MVCSSENPQVLLIPKNLENIPNLYRWQRLGQFSEFIYKINKSFAALCGYMRVWKKDQWNYTVFFNFSYIISIENPITQDLMGGENIHNFGYISTQTAKWKA